MILLQDLMEAFRFCSSHLSSEHYIHGEFTPFLETRSNMVKNKSMNDLKWGLTFKWRANRWYIIRFFV
uniref:Uncharacterized protein n=1 Tax=Lepeophtheirus salmonis TaxID=72036 RepID=A0A0K2T4J8_LEPSM